MESTVLTFQIVLMVAAALVGARAAPAGAGAASTFDMSHFKDYRFTQNKNYPNDIINKYLRQLNFSMGSPQKLTYNDRFGLDVNGFKDGCNVIPANSSRMYEILYNNVMRFVVQGELLFHQEIQLAKCASSDSLANVLNDVEGDDRKKIVCETVELQYNLLVLREDKTGFETITPSLPVGCACRYRP